MRSILVGHHYGDGGLGIVDVQRAAHGDQLDQAGAMGVIADVEGERQAGLAGARFADGKAEHPDNIPEAAGFVLAGHARRDCDVRAMNGAGEENGEADSGFLGNARNVNLFAIGEGLGAGVGVDHGAEWLGGVVGYGVHGVSG